METLVPCKNVQNKTIVWFFWLCTKVQIVQSPKCHNFWSKVKKLKNLNIDQNVTNSDLRSKNYKIWRMTKMPKILIIRQKSTKSEKWPRCRKFWYNVKKLQNQGVKSSFKHQKITKSEQWTKLRKFWSKVKNLQNLNNNWNVTDIDKNKK